MELGLNEPVIVENGSGIYLTLDTDITFSGYDQVNLHGRRAIVLGELYDKILSSLEESGKAFYPGLLYYASLPVEEITKITGLSTESAGKAKERDFSETLFNADLRSTAYQNLEKALKSQGLQPTPGSKYVTITSNRSDKGKAVKLVIDAYTKEFGKVVSYGIGDSFNDLAMLKTVDLPYLVQKPDKSWADIHLDKLSKGAAIGPAGWNVMAREVLAR